MNDANRLTARVTMLLVVLIAGLPLATAEPPRLVLFVVVDQLRGDMPPRFRERFGPAGFRRLMDGGVDFRNAHYLSATTLTATGFATLSTGRQPREHGMVANVWFDREQERQVYCVEGATPDRRTPEQLLAPTLGDRLSEATEGQAKVFGVSIKNRAAILLAGRRGKALWYSETAGTFVSDEAWYWPDGMPDWIRRFNAPVAGATGTRADRWRDRVWEPRNPIEAYAAACPRGAIDCVSSAPFAAPVFADATGAPQIGFPYRPGSAGPAFYSVLRATPFGDELTVELAKAVIRNEKLGADTIPDLLAVGLSTTDFVGHAFGPDSVEYEDNLLRVDATLADLFAFVDHAVGLDRTLIVLSADHGIDSIPDYKRTLGFSAGRIDEPLQLTERLNQRLSIRFETDEALVAGVWVPGVYLDHAARQRAGIDRQNAELALAQEIRAVDGLSRGVARAEIAVAGQLEHDRLLQRVRLAYHPQRSGDVIAIQNHSWFFYNRTVAQAMHGSPYEYDTHVPLMIAGPGVAPRTVWRRVAPVQIVPTLVGLLDLPRSMRDAEALDEVLAGKDGP